MYIHTLCLYVCLHFSLFSHQRAKEYTLTHTHTLSHLFSHFLPALLPPLTERGPRLTMRGCVLRTAEQPDDVAATDRSCPWGELCVLRV